MNKEDIKDIVNGLIEHVQSNRLGDILDLLNIEVVEINIDDSKYACYLKGQRRETIFISKNCPNEYKDFLIAHELGHAVLHDVELVNYSPFQHRKTRLEEEADYFAFILLGKEVDPIEGYTLEDYSKLLGLDVNIIKNIYEEV